MLKITLTIMLAATAAVLASEDLLATPTNDEAVPPIKIDKNLRRALLRALVDLEAESAEQHREEEETENDESTINRSMDIEKKDLNNNFGTVNKFGIEEFNNREIPNEDNLQNSTFIEIEKYVPESTTIATKEEEVSVNEVKYSRIEDKSHGSEEVALTLSNDTQHLASPVELLTMSASNGIATANALVAPKPTVSSPTVSPADNFTKSELKKKQQETAEDVKIFQAPLIAAFTVQQDERGVPKSVVPIYKGIGNAQALTLQEQLEFKQKLLEKQLAELQQQQIQQTQFLIQQRQIYEEQLRRKQRIQQEQRYREEQALRQKQIQEQQNRAKLLEEQRRNQIEEQKKLEEQRLFQEQQQKRLQLFNNFEQANQIHPNFKTTNVRLQPSLTLEVPTAAVPPPFRQSSFGAQAQPQSVRNNNQFQQQQFQQQIQQFQQFQQQLPFQQVQQQQQQQFQQQQGFAEVSPIAAPATRFHRQEAFGSVGNFGINNNVEKNNVRTNFIFPTQQQRFPSPAPINNFNFANLNQFRQLRFPQATQTPTSSPARQIQHLLYQSGVANNLAAGGPGPAGQEDLNIVSKVLALNVGAIPNNNLQFAASHPVASFVKLPNVS